MKTDIQTVKIFVKRQKHTCIATYSPNMDVFNHNLQFHQVCDIIIQHFKNEFNLNKNNKEITTLKN